MNKRGLINVICGLVLVFGSNAYSQKCGSARLKDIIIAKNPAAAVWFDSLRISNSLAAQNALTAAGQKTTAANPIPVIFHVVLDAASLADAGGTAGIAARAASQIQVLNDGFAGLNADSTNIPADFKSRFGKSAIRFGLAHRTPAGTSTPGYEITVTSNTAGFSYLNNTAGSTVIYSDAKYSATNGAPSWDYTKYLNIWIIKSSNGTELGGTLPPSYIGQLGITGQEIGLVISYDAFGAKSFAATAFKTKIDKGKTTIHEMGHYFELVHIWGDDNGACPGNGGVDDGFTDTPPQANATYGDPVFPRLDACSTVSPGIMYNNYMDYTNDSSMLLFTQQQVAAMDAKIAVGGESYSLTQHPEILQYPSAVHEVFARYDVNIYPNPTIGTISISIPAGLEKLKTVSVMNMMGQQVKALILTSGTSLVIEDLSSLSNGIYTLHCQFEDQTILRKIILQR